MDGGETARRMLGSCGGEVFRNKAIINPIMMRFRPIAPKPVVGGSVSDGASAVESKIAFISKGRTKRKYVRVRRYNRKKKTDDQIAVTTTATATATLQLLPELKLELEFGGGGGCGGSLPAELNRITEGSSEAAAVSDLSRRAVELWVTVECVTDACMEQEEIGCTDEERMKNLEEDTCPGFVSDGVNRVEWVNKAFKRMVRQRQRQRSDSESPAEIVVWLISKPRLPNMSGGFTCQIKLQFKWGTEMEKDSKVVPCDAWRMDGGGFAWKLDVKAALSLAPLLQED